MLNVVILGSGNIGCDILFKVLRSPYLNCSYFIGRNPYSKGIELAQRLGINTSTKGINEIVDNPDGCDLMFDATSATDHEKHAVILKTLNKKIINLTPANTGVYCVPSIDLHKIYSADNINLITCGGQASIPIISAVSRVCPEIDYVEVVSSISSKSAGAATRLNIDEYMHTTERALSLYSAAKQTKSILIINPAEPAINMAVTIYFIIKQFDIKIIEESIYKMVKTVQQYVPGYQLIVGPIVDNNRLLVTVNVNGNGDYLPSYAGNLDIITNAAVYIAESIAQKYKDR